MSDRFKNCKEALDWLQTRGQISQGKFYADCKKGYPAVHADKTLSKWQVMEYAERVFGGVREIPTSVDAQVKKERLELEKLELDVEKRRIESRKDDERWLPRDDAWAALAGIIGTLRDSLRHQFHVGAPHLIHLAGGDPHRAPEVYEGAEELLARAFNEVVAAGKIDGVFRRDEEI